MLSLGTETGGGKGDPLSLSGIPCRNQARQDLPDRASQLR